MFPHAGPGAQVTLLSSSPLPIPNVSDFTRRDGVYGTCWSESFTIRAPLLQARVWLLHPARTVFPSVSLSSFPSPLSLLCTRTMAPHGVSCPLSSCMCVCVVLSLYCGMCGGPLPLFLLHRAVAVAPTTNHPQCRAQSEWEPGRARASFSPLLPLTCRRPDCMSHALSVPLLIPYALCVSSPFSVCVCICPAHCIASLSPPFPSLSLSPPHTAKSLLLHSLVKLLSVGRARAH